MKFTNSITIASLLFTSALAAPVKRQSSEGGEGDGVLDPALQGTSGAVGDTGILGATEPLADALNGATNNEGVGSQIFSEVNGIVLRRDDGGEGDGVLDPALEGTSGAVGDTGVLGATEPLADALNGATDNEGVGSQIFSEVNGIVLRRDDGGEGDGILDPALEGTSGAVGDTGVLGATEPLADALNGATDNEGVGSQIFSEVNGIVARQVEGGNGGEDIDNDNPVAVLAKTGSEFFDGLATVIS